MSGEGPSVLTPPPGTSERNPPLPFWGAGYSLPEKTPETFSSQPGMVAIEEVPTPQEEEPLPLLVTGELPSGESVEALTYAHASIWDHFPHSRGGTPDRAGGRPPGPCLLDPSGPARVVSPTHSAQTTEE